MMRAYWCRLGAIAFLIGACEGTSVPPAFAPDPDLQASSPPESPAPPSEPSPPTAPAPVEPSPEEQGESLSEQFPQAIPLYPQRGPLRWQEIEPQRGEVRWQLAASDLTAALEYYVTALTEAGWQVDDAVPAGTIAARQPPLQIEVTGGDRELILRYQQLPETAVTQPNPTTPETPTAKFVDVDDVPSALQEAVRKVSATGILTPVAPGTQQFAPNQPVTRRTFARWLLAAHTQRWQERPERQIRPATSATDPVFTDIPASDPDFVTIQTLAMAGIIPSPLGADGPSTFKPDTRLKRETLVAWKILMEQPGGLSAATANQVRELWGFQDADRIDPANLPAIAADFASGDRANLRRLYGYTRLLQPQQAVTRAEAAAALAAFGPEPEPPKPTDAAPTATN